MVRKTSDEIAERVVRSAARAVRDEVQGTPDNGWRNGKPVEDPEKTKRWGFVTAKPSEYLVHMRRGRVLPKTSGQGASCFKWPWDSVAIIPTTLQRLYFSADQVTAEKVGVEIKGLAVYRVARPELAVTMLNFSFPERAQEKLAETLGDMFVGAVRRLVANLRVEECLTRRKEALASFLMSEIAPVVSGEGRATDGTEKGWGVVIDTIEIQDVHVLSEKVFADMQAPFRNQLLLKARESELARERELEEIQARAQGEMRELKARTETNAVHAEAEEERKRLAVRGEADRARLESEREMERRKLEKEAELARIRAEKTAEVASLQARQQGEARKVKAAGELEVTETESAAATRRQELEVEAGRRREELEAAAQRERLEREQETARLQVLHEAELARAKAKTAREAAEAEDALAAERAQRTLELQKNEAASRGEVRRLELELARLEGEMRTALAARQREVENTISFAKLQSDFVNTALPEIAQVMQQQFGKIEVIAGAGENPFNFLVHAFEGVMDIAKRGGLSLDGAGKVVAPSADDPTR